MERGGAQWAERLNSRTLGRIFTKKGAQVVVKSLLEGYLRAKDTTKVFFEKTDYFHIFGLGLFLRLIIINHD